MTYYLALGLFFAVWITFADRKERPVIACLAVVSLATWILADLGWSPL